MRIIAATDFSDIALDATRTAARLARKLGDELELVRVVEPLALTYPELDVAGYESIVTAIDGANEAQMARAVATMRADQVEPTGTLLRGAPPIAIAAHAEESGARLIVVGTHGRGAAARIALGSVAERTILHARCAVLVVRKGCAPFDEWAAGERQLRVVAGVDGGSPTAAALGWVKLLRQAGPCHVTLVHDFWPPDEYQRLGIRGRCEIGGSDPEVTRTLEGELRARVGELAGAPDVTLRVLPDWGRVGDALVIEAERDRADLLIVGTHQRHGLDRLRFGSTALAVVRVAHCAVLCVPQGARAGEIAAAAP